MLALLNSTALDFYFKRIAKPKDREYFEANKQFIAPLPIPNVTPKDQKPLADLAKKLASLHARRLKATAAVHRRLATDLPPAKLLKESPLPPRLTRRLLAFDETPFAELVRDMEKLAERKLKPAERGRWDEYVTKEREAVGGISQQIARLMDELNDRVYRLYGLTKDEIRTIEESTPMRGLPPGRSHDARVQSPSDNWSERLERQPPVNIGGGPLSDDIIRDRR